MIIFYKNEFPDVHYLSPDCDGIALKNIGTHEHWNNLTDTDKKYSRNLGLNEGIELVSVEL